LCALPGAKGARREHRFNPLFLPRLDKLGVVIIVLFPSNRMTVYLDTFCREYSKSLHHQFP
ncbi:hypothetical protein, partial [Anaerotignum lactatifermentans]|uniref:hypothetical protein n=1 Tax=Anaerotignum lactatifermentans TaxID=160404 RepID=UPI001961F654